MNTLHSSWHDYSCLDFRQRTSEVWWTSVKFLPSSVPSASTLLRYALSCPLLWKESQYDLMSVSGYRFLSMTHNVQGKFLYLCAGASWIFWSCNNELFFAQFVRRATMRQDTFQCISRHCFKDSWNPGLVVGCSGPIAGPDYRDTRGGKHDRLDIVHWLQLKVLTDFKLKWSERIEIIHEIHFFQVMMTLSFKTFANYWSDMYI